MTPAQRMAAIFVGGSPRSHYIADFTKTMRDKTGKLVPGYMGENGKFVSGYKNKKGPATLADFDAHLAGTCGLLIVPVNTDGTCRFGKIDVDEYSIEGADLARRVKAKGLPLIVERSKSGGWHLAWYLRDLRPAAEVRAQLEAWAAELSIKIPPSEIFPKQDRLSDDDDKGSGINLPYFRGDAATNYAINSDGARLTLDAWLTAIEQYPQWQQATDPLSEPVRLLAKHWADGQRQNLSFAVSGFLLRHDKSVEYCDRLMDAVVAKTGVKPKNFRHPFDVRRLLDRDRHVDGFPTMCQIMGDGDAEAFADAVGISKPDSESAKPFPLTLVYSVAQFNELPIRAREYIVEGVLLTQTLAMLYAARGLGKTMLALDLAVNVARGTGKFLVWGIPVARQVLYVDGEMSAAELQERLKKFVGTDVPERLDVIASEKFYHCEESPLNLADVVQQARFVGLLDELKANARNPELIILDNKSALSAGADENSNSEQDSFLAFLRELRHRGHAVLVVHHAGKSGDQRGASRNEDFLDLTIRLDIPGGDEKKPRELPRGAAFRLTFTKHRGLRPDPAMLDVELMEDMDGTFTWGIEKPRRQQNWFRVLDFLYDHASTKQAQIGDALGIDKSNMSAHVKELRRRSFLHDETLELTASARAYVEAARRRKTTDGGAKS
jgi:putative DNA primase/helicase